MKLFKYYSLDECVNIDVVYKILNKLQEELKIEYEEEDTDIIKIVDIGLSLSDIKKLIGNFEKNDVIPYTDYDDEEEEDIDDNVYEW